LRFSVAIYDPQYLTRQGMKAVVEKVTQAQDIHLLKTDQNLEDQVYRIEPQLLTLEYKGRHTIQPQTLERIKQRLPDTRVLIISDDDDALMIKQYLGLGIEGFLTKQCSTHELTKAVNSIMSGGKFYCQRIIEVITQKDIPNAMELSDREMQVIRYIGKGLSSERIATELNVSIHTVNSHRKNVLKKLGLKSPTELIVYAVKQGWVSI